MLTLHGVSKDEIITSLTQAANFLHSLNVGPHANVWAQNYLADAEGIKQVQRAHTQEELREVLRPICVRLSHYFWLFKTHAILNTDKQGRDVYMSLCRWRPFGAVSLAPYAPAKEADQHVDSLHPKRKLRNAFAVGKYVAKCMAAREDVLDARKFAVDPIASYGLVMGEAEVPISSTVAKSEAFQDMTDRLLQDLSSHLEAGDIKTIGAQSFKVGDVYKHCVFLESTRAVAQQLADRFAGQKEVITDKGEVVQPSNRIKTPAISQGRASDGVAKDHSTGYQKR